MKLLLTNFAAVLGVDITSVKEIPNLDGVPSELCGGCKGFGYRYDAPYGTWRRLDATCRTCKGAGRVASGA